VASSTFFLIYFKRSSLNIGSPVAFWRDAMASGLRVNSLEQWSQIYRKAFLCKGAAAIESADGAGSRMG
jgi:hypothetical protein